MPTATAAVLSNPFEEIQQAADDAAAAGTVVKPVLRMPGATT